MDNVTFLERTCPKSKVCVLGVPTDLGKDVEGTSEGPDHLRKHGLIEALCDLGFHVKDLGNILIPLVSSRTFRASKNEPLLEAIVTVANSTVAAISNEIKMGKKIIALGGDHSMSLGTISGASVALEGDIGVIWIDAHGDMNTHETSMSGHVHGMPAAALMGFGHPALVNIFERGAKVKKENILFIGLRDLDKSEIDLIHREKLNVVTMMDILEKGFGFATRKVEELRSRVENIWVSLDIDAIDKDAAPASLMATSGGLSYREITNLAKYIGKTCNSIGMDIAEFMPALDQEEKTTQLIIRLITNFLGADYSWYMKYMRQYSS